MAKTLMPVGGKSYSVGRADAEYAWITILYVKVTNYSIFCNVKFKANQLLDTVLVQSAEHIPMIE